MSNQKNDETNSLPGKRLLEALTQEEVITLLDAIFAVLPSDTMGVILAQLAPDSRQTVQRVLSSPVAGDTEIAAEDLASLAKLKETWHALWREWHDIVVEASQEDGDYMIQEAHWEPPYLSETKVVDDLERVASKMRPLLQTAFTEWDPEDYNFAESLELAVDEILGGMPEWIHVEGFYLEKDLTFCMLEWEWLISRLEDEDAFAFAQRIVSWEQNNRIITFEEDTFFDFFTGLPERDQLVIFKGLSEHKESAPWKSRLKSTYSYWHSFYMYCVDKFSPEQYIDNLRVTIPQHWQNGLPVIEDLLTKADYKEGHQVVQETLSAMLKTEQIRAPWTPETRLLCGLIGRHKNEAGLLQNHQTLLTYYQQIGQELGRSDLANALALQLITFEHCFNWKAMFKAFAETPISETVQQALFTSWREYISQQAKPASWGWGWSSPAPRDTWWLLWLLDSIIDDQKGSTMFQQQMAEWLNNLPDNKHTLGEDYDFLRLLTNDLSEINRSEKARYPHFYRVVIRSDALGTPDQTSRRVYLKQYAPDNLMAQVMDYWTANLKHFVPKPERAEKSDYTSHAQWMVALREVVPDSYNALRHDWETQHHRRRNLWKAMAEVGLQ